MNTLKAHKLSFDAFAWVARKFIAEIDSIFEPSIDFSKPGDKWVKFSSDLETTEPVIVFHAYPGALKVADGRKMAAVFTIQSDKSLAVCVQVVGKLGAGKSFLVNETDTSLFVLT